MSIEKIILKHPLLVNGTDRKELTYDLEELTTVDVAKAEAAKNKLGTVASTHVLFDYSMHIEIAKQAILKLNPDISDEDLNRIKGRDLNKLAKAGISFFSESEEQEENTSEKPQEDTQDTTIVQ